jgi:hypothetical protein
VLGQFKLNKSADHAPIDLLDPLRRAYRIGVGFKMRSLAHTGATLSQ